MVLFITTPTDEDRGLGDRNLRSLVEKLGWRPRESFCQRRHCSMSLGFSSEAWPFVVNVSYWHRRGIYSKGLQDPTEGTQNRALSSSFQTSEDSGGQE